MPSIIQERLDSLQSRVLLSGAHSDVEQGMCVMEAVAFVAGEEFSDHPKCACPVTAEFLRSWGDVIPDDESRTRLLKPLVPRLVGSRSSKQVEQRRADLVFDWVIRTNTAHLLDMTPELKEHAAALRALPPLLSKKASVYAQPTIVAAREAAKKSAAARAAAWDAARDAAVPAAWAAWAAAQQAAAAKKVDIAGLSYAEAYDAAKPACVAQFAPTRDTFERSALDLVDAMLAVTQDDVAIAQKETN